MKTVFIRAHQTLCLVFMFISWWTCEGQTDMSDIFKLAGCMASGGIWYLQPATISECANTCIQQSRCQAINFNRLSSLCILRDSSVAPVTDGICYHVVIEDIQKLQAMNRTGIMDTTDPCSARPCGNHSACESYVKPTRFVCRLLYCDNTRIPLIPNAEIRSNDSTKIHSTNAYTCDPGYTMFGDSRIHCLADGNWSTVSVTCYKDCSAKIQRIGATVTSWSAMRFAYTTTVNFTCNSGYYSFVPTSMTCENDGTWTPFHCFKYCVQGDIPSIENGTPATGSIYNVHQRAIYSCNQGYYMSPEPDNIACKSNGTWNEPTTKCWKYCLVPTGPANSYIQDNPLPPYTSGAKVTFACSHDYYADNEDTSVNCNTNGTWSSTLFHCNKYCGQPPLDQTDVLAVFEGVPYTEINSGGGLARYTTANKVGYSCMHGSSISGNSERHCTADGSWAGSITCCIKVIVSYCCTGEHCSF